MTFVVKPVASNYGMLTVLGHERGLGWRVRCDCGTERYFDGGALRTDTYRSCGCTRYKRHAAMMKARHQKAKAVQNAHKIPLRHPKSGTACWCCRNKTGANAAVALCYICRGDV